MVLAYWATSDRLARLSCNVWYLVYFHPVGLLLNIVSDISYTLVDPRIILRDANAATQPRQSGPLGAFRHNRRGYWSLWIFLVLFGLICVLNLSPTINRCWCVMTAVVFPVVEKLQRKRFWRPAGKSADYQDPWLKQRLENNGWVLWHRFALVLPVSTLLPISPSLSTLPAKLAGNGCQWRRCTGTILYGTRISVLFGLMLTLCST